MKPAEIRLLTQVELELMNMVWAQNEATVHSVIEALPKDRPMAYTSVSTILRILEKKGILASRKHGRGHAYFPLISKQQYEATSVRHLVANVFSNTPSAMVRTLLDSKNLTIRDIEEIKTLLDSRIGEHAE